MNGSASALCVVGPSLGLAMVAPISEPTVLVVPRHHLPTTGEHGDDRGQRGGDEQGRAADGMVAGDQNQAEREGDQGNERGANDHDGPASVGRVPHLARVTRESASWSSFATGRSVELDRLGGYPSRSTPAPCAAERSLCPRSHLGSACFTCTIVTP